MKSFKLQPVLDYRTLVKNLAQQELRRSRETEAAMAAEIERARAELVLLHQDLEARQREGISVQELTIYETHSDRRLREIEQMGLELEGLREKIAQDLLNLTEANRNKKLLEKLKEKVLAQHQLGLRRKETAAADETAGQRQLKTNLP